MDKPKQDKPKQDKDINDIFSDILLSEEHVIEQSFSEGYSIGVREGNTEAFHLGYHRGAELGAEIGYITGFVNSYLKYFELNEAPLEKIMESLTDLKELLGSFPHHNDTAVDMIQLTANIRIRFKKLCALLKVSCPLYKIEGLSF